MPADSATEERIAALEAQLASLRGVADREGRHVQVLRQQQQNQQNLEWRPAPPAPRSLHDLMHQHRLPVSAAQRGMAAFRVRYGRWLNPHAITPADAALLLVEVQTAQAHPRQFRPPAGASVHQLLTELRHEAEVLHRSAAQAEIILLVLLDGKISPLAVERYKKQLRHLLREDERP